MKYLLDTDIIIFFLRGKFNILDKINSIGLENCFISEITIAELKFGAVKSENFEKHYKEVELVEKMFIILPVYDIFDTYALERNRLQKKGLLIPDFDLLIGTTSLVHNMIMVSNNEKHLKRIDGITLNNWVKEND